MAAQISRRGFVGAAAGMTGIAVMVPDALAFKLQGRLTPTFSGGTFPDGIASGDPTPTGITLWTRIFGVSGNGSVLLEIATDSKFKKLQTVRAKSTALASSKTYKVAANSTTIS